MNNIQEIAVGRFEGTYSIPLTESDRERLKDEVVSSSTTLKLKKEQKKEIDKELTAEINILDKQIGDNLTTINSGMMQKQGTLYLVPDHEKGMMEHYDERGILVETMTRRLRPDERQETLKLVASNL